jgi:hypothetical protein
MAIAFVFSHFTDMAQASSSGPPTGRTGAPGESTCTSCHSANAQTGQFIITPPANYVPGQTYTVQVQNTTSDSSRAAWGFELTSLTSANAPAGTFANTTSFTRVRTATNGRNYIEQNTAGTFPGQSGGATWTFNWTAPATDVGSITFYAAGLHADNDGGDGGDQTYTRSAVSAPSQPVIIHHGFSDFDADGKADASVYRPNEGIWYLDRSSAGQIAVQWGIATDRLAPADFDGDDKTDIAVWRADAPTLAAFYILESSTNTVRIEPFGQTGDDVTVIGDWDGDGKADPSCYRDSAIGSQSYFFYRGSLNNPGGTITYVKWGIAGDIAIRGDFDGDAKADPAVFRPSTGIWYIGQSSTGAIRYDYWGLATDKFVPADYDGDSKTDLAVFRNGIWYIKQSSNGLPLYFNWGLNTDRLVPADYDGDARTDPAIFRNGVWYARMSGSGALSARTFGQAADVPVPGAFVK